ncbi:MAG: hypothetical protein AAFV53_20690 [Myxococcota bacterium]
MNDPDPKPISPMASIASPSQPIARLSPEEMEPYILAGIQQDRTPGNVLVVLHPLKVEKLPVGLFDALTERGFRVQVQETAIDEMDSVRGIRDALRQLRADPGPLDVIVVGGDGTLDHHFLLASFAAFFPDLVEERPGVIAAERLTREDLERVPSSWRKALDLAEAPPSVAPTLENVRGIWRLQDDIQQGMQKGRRGLSQLLRRRGLTRDDPILRLATMWAVAPGRVTVQAPHFDLQALIDASQEQTFRGLYPWVRSVTSYPAGTAADNAIFAGVPGLTLGLLAKTLGRTSLLAPIRARLDQRTLDAFLDFFCTASTVVPTRISMVAMDGRWQRVGSHGIGGPGSGRIFSGDLRHKPRGVIGYVARLLPAIYREGVIGETRLRVAAYSPDGEERSVMEGGIAEGLYTNRTFIAALGSIPTTTPTSFAGESSLLMLPSVLSRDDDGRRVFNVRGVLGIIEGAVKGILARAMHFVGVDPGRLAGEGELIGLPPSHQVSLKEGAEVRIRYADAEGRPRPVPVQISGDPYYASQMRIRVFWGPLPMLAAHGSLLHASARRTLRHLRLQDSYNLGGTYIGGVHHFWHRVGIVPREEIGARFGVTPPPRHLRLPLSAAAEKLAYKWAKLGVTDLVDTSGPGLDLGKGEIRQHTNDLSAHLVLVREGRARLLVRQVRRLEDGTVVEARCHYRRSWGAWLITDSQLLQWAAGKPPRIVFEERFFRDIRQFQGVAPTFFPILSTAPDAPTLSTTWEDEDERG